MNSLFVIFKVAGTEYAISANEVRQLETYSGTTPVPGTSNFVVGLVQIRQQVVPVIDARIRLGLAPTPATSESRIIVLSVEGRLVGIVVDSAREVQTLAQENFQDPPELVVKQSAGFVKSIAQIKDRMILLIDAPKFIGQEVSHG